MQGVGEFDSDDVIAESFAIGNWPHLCPVLAGIGRVEECPTRASHPDIEAVSGESSKNCLDRDLNRLPASAGIKRPLQRAIRA